MVTPVTGPISGSFYGGFVGLPKGWQYNVWRKYRQKMPIDRPLPYWKVSRQSYYAYSNLTSGNCYNWKQTAQDPGYTGTLGYYDVLADVDFENRHGLVTRSLNAAGESFRGAIGEQAEWMVNALQYNQSLEMVSKAMMKLRKFTKAVKRGNFDEAFRQFSPVHRTRAMAHYRSSGGRPTAFAQSGGGVDVGGSLSNVGAAWLTYSYGVKPLVQDVYNGIDIITRKPENRFWPKPGKGYDERILTESYTYTTNTFVKLRERMRVQAKCGGIVVITNPNVFALSSLGLTNPVAWAWELIPFSFVVDWFVNVGDVLSSMVPDLGFRVEKPWSSYKVITELDGICTFDGAATPPLDHQFAQVKRRIFALKRFDSLPPVKLVVKRNWLTSLPRALNASSLLAVQLKPGYKGPGRH